MIDLQDRTPSRAPRRRAAALRALLLLAILLILLQSVAGVVVNLYVAIPRSHPGAEPHNYLSGSYQSVVWAVTHGAPALAVHASLGAALVVLGIGAAVHAVRAHRRAVAVWSTLGTLLVVGAAFNGASFLDFADHASSLIMACLAFGAVACFSFALYLLGGRP